MAVGGVSELPGDASFPKIGGDRSDGKATLGQSDRRTEYLAYGQLAMSVYQITPPRTCTGDGDRMGVKWRQLVCEPFLSQSFQVQGCRRPA